jgi:hypothetical protein
MFVTSAPPEAAEAARFSKRIVICEEPVVAAKLVELAREAGHSTAAECRAALRWWIQSVEGNR